MRVQRIRVERIAQSKSPSQILRYLPCVLGIEVEIQKVEGLIGRGGKRLRRRRGDAVDILRQRRESDRRHRALGEVVVVQPEDSRISSEAKFVRAVAPCQVVVDKEAGRAPSLNPGIIQSSDFGERRICAAALQHDRKRRQGLLQIAWPEQAFVPGKGWIEIIHEMLRKDVRVSGCERVERLRRDRIEERIDRVGISGLYSIVELKTEPRCISLVDVVVDAGRLDLLMVITQMRDALPVRATVSIVGDRGSAPADIERAAQYC